MVYLIQSQDSLNESINMLEPQVSRLVNTNDKKEETLPTQSLTIPNFHKHIDRDQKSLCLENFNQDLISSHHLELDQYQTIHKLASFHSMKLNLIMNATPIPNFEIQFHFLNLCCLWYPYPIWTQFPSQHWFSYL